MLRQVWREWANALILVQPDSVVDWQRQGFKLIKSALQTVLVGGLAAGVAYALAKLIS